MSREAVENLIDKYIRLNRQRSLTDVESVHLSRLIATEKQAKADRQRDAVRVRDLRANLIVRGVISS